MNGVVCEVDVETHIADIDRRVDEYENFRANAFYIRKPGGYKIQPVVYFDEDDISVDIELVPGSYDNELRWPFRGSITIELVDESDDDNNYQRVICYDRQSSVKHEDRYSGLLLPEVLISTDEFFDCYVSNNGHAVLIVTRVEYFD